MANSDEMRALVDLSRRKKIWLVVDEVYERIVYDRDVAPSALDYASPDDLVISVNSFSKAWNMTGWRLGWLVTPPGLRVHLAKLNEINTSNPPVFIQQAGVVALRDGEDIVRENREQYARGRDYVLNALGDIPNVTMMKPQAAFYAFLKLDGVTDSLDFARKMLTETGVGVAPGVAFGDDCEAWFRICFASGPDRLKPAVDRLAAYLRQNR
jgi:aspartate/methionine/tyrosine aminotransferase